MDVFQKKGLAKWAICKWLKRKGVEQWCVTRGEFQNGNFGYSLKVFIRIDSRGVTAVTVGEKM